ncbi:endonuclease domain-containing protein [uncultured Draconibacterium sp.]|uniref:endonuclease domain-containing protein n=1 Tax=uncultured Draconibacterium sp. TaxID=1573823 RepID=UPI0029C6E544|nr:endonuclease domain-containing protein [uncultured Draconibacterium sp.]
MDSNNPNNKPRWQTANSDFYKKYKDERKKLKDETTKAENMLWEKLRNKQLGVKFRRQHIIDFYIPDFVALTIKLIIAVDGKIHIYKKAEDKERTKRLAAIGYKVIRFSNEEVENDIDKVVVKIKDEVDKLPPPNPSASRQKE